MWSKNEHQSDTVPAVRCQRVVASVCALYTSQHTTVSKATGRHLDFGLLLTSTTVAEEFYKYRNSRDSVPWTALSNTQYIELHYHTVMIKKPSDAKNQKTTCEALCNTRWAIKSS